MNFALLGDDNTSLPLIRAIAAHPVHRLVVAAFVDSTLPELLRLAPSVRVVPHWEDVLTEKSLDAVLVASADEGVLAGAKQLAASGNPLLLLPRAAQGSTFVYELSLIRDDSRATLFPAFAYRFDPIVQNIRQKIDDGVLGTVLHLQLEREIPKRVDSNAPLLPSAETVDQILLDDVDLLRQLGGQFSRVTALRSEPALTHATVTLAGENCPEAVWSVKATASQPCGQLTVTGDSGTAVLAMDENGSTLELRLVAADEVICETEIDLDAATDVLQRFEMAVAGKPVDPDWTDATRAFEIIDAARQSDARRRTVDVHFETTSERAIFKTQMTAIGCGVLAFTLVGLVLYLLAASLFDLNPTVLRVARFLWIAPLLVFLLLQLFVFIAKPSRSD